MAVDLRGGHGIAGAGLNDGIVSARLTEGFCCMAVPAASEPEFEAVAAIFRKLCRHPLPDLTPETHLDELPGMDSLRVLQAIALMEEQFGVEIDVAALDRMYQVRDILRAVHASRNAAGFNADTAG
jgi:acyl carrier protein